MFACLGGRVDFRTTSSRVLSTVSREMMTFRFTKSGGPGGQHVNKTNTKVDARFVVQDAAWLTENQRDRLARKHRHRINNEGELIVTSQTSRSRVENVADCVQKLQEIVDSLDGAVPTAREEVGGERTEKILMSKEP